MKYFVCTLLLALVGLTATAQKEQDFASTFMKRYAGGTAATCTTVSPAMMMKMMKLDEVEQNRETAETLRRLKSVRLVNCRERHDAETLYAKAEALAKANDKRYTLFDTYDGKRIYTRRRGKVFVELVLLTCRGGTLTIVNLTGNMTEQFIRSLTGS